MALDTFIKYETLYLLAFFYEQVYLKYETDRGYHFELRRLSKEVHTSAILQELGSDKNLFY